MQESKNEAIKKLEDQRNEINKLKLELNQIDDQKEASFSEKERLSKEISKLISEIKNCKVKRDQLTKSVRELKDSRNSLNKTIAEKINLIKEMKKNDSAAARPKYNIGILKKEIDQMEFKIETDGMSFDKEQKLMKILKEKKKEYKELQKIYGAYEEANKLSREIDEMKDEAEEQHNKIQKSAAESQEMHEKMLSLSKEVDEMKKNEQAAYDKFFELKTKFNETNNKLKAILLEIGKTTAEVDKYKNDSRKEKKNKESQILKDKEKSIQEKIRSGKKITTDDLLIFQNQQSDEE